MTRPNKRSAAQESRLPEHPKPSAPSASGLRRRAEDVFLENAAQGPGSLEALSPEATRQMLHELGVHQIELEMLNEELRLAQVALDSALEHYVDLYDHAPVGYFSVSDAGLILQANLHTAALLGFARGALVSRPISSVICKEDQDIYYLCRKKTIEADEAQSCELRMMKHAGEPFWASLAISMAQDNGGAPVYRAVLNEITERKQAEESLRDSEKKYRVLIQKVHTAVVVHGPDTRILDSNPMAQELLGLTEDQLLGKAAIDPAWHFRREDGTAMGVEEYPVNQVIARGQAVKNLVIEVHRPGSRQGTNVWVLVNANPVFGNESEILQVIVTFVDITERKPRL